LYRAFSAKSNRATNKTHLLLARIRTFSLPWNTFLKTLAWTVHLKIEMEHGYRILFIKFATISGSLRQPNKSACVPGKIEVLGI
jgi:hypothetical protein